MRMFKKLGFMPCVGFYMMHICNIYPAINWFWIICSFHLNLNEDSEVNGNIGPIFNPPAR